MQHAFVPVRMYYRLMRVLWGPTKNLFGTNVKDGVHPLIVYYKRYSDEIRMVTLLCEQLIPSICLLLIFSFIHGILDSVKILSLCV